jgi:hypothetical protein
MGRILRERCGANQGPTTKLAFLSVSPNPGAANDVLGQTAKEGMNATDSKRRK